MPESSPPAGSQSQSLAATRHSEGIALMQQGKFGEGLPLLRLALEAEPANGQYWLSLAHGLLISGDPQTALRIVQQAIDGGLKAPVALKLRQEAQSALSRPRPAAPEPAAPELNRLDALLRAGSHVPVESYVTELLTRYPHSGYLWSVLGYSRLSQKKDAIEPLQKAAVLMPDDADTHNTLGVALQKAGRMQDALNEFRLAVRLSPDNFEAQSNLGNALRDLGEVQEAVACHRTALSINPRFAQAHNNLGNALRDLGQLDNAMASVRRALDINPAHANAHNNLGMMLMDQGRYEASRASFAKALDLKPDYFEALSNLLFVLNLLPDSPPEDMLALAKKYGKLVASQPAVDTAEIKGPQAEKHLRIGLVSGDLRSHPVGYFVESVLKAMAESHAGEMSFHAYANHFMEDELTARLKQYCEGWNRVSGLTDDQLTQRIKLDGIDILVDLSGHTAFNRLPLFALRPAPVQVTWLGYFATTGVAEMDHLLADPWTLPPSEEANFTEHVWRLPQTRLCFTPPDVEVALSSLPALDNQCITFGCFNNLAKMNDEVVALWSRILTAIPSSRLFLKAKQLRETSVCASVIKRFDAHGVCAEQLLLEGSEPRAAYLAAYRRVDIALDPFPYPGGATTAEALWMGVPVLTLCGQRFLSRQGVGLLMNAGLSKWVANDPDDYVNRAISLSANLEALNSLRHGLRAQVLDSPLFDAKGFGNNLATAFRAMWIQKVAPKSAN